MYLAVSQHRSMRLCAWGEVARASMDLTELYSIIIKTSPTHLMHDLLILRPSLAITHPMHDLLIPGPSLSITHPMHSLLIPRPSLSITHPMHSLLIPGPSLCIPCMASSSPDPHYPIHRLVAWKPCIYGQ